MLEGWIAVGGLCVLALFVVVVVANELRVYRMMRRRRPPAEVIDFTRPRRRG
jgi:hypothetical protein